MFRISYSNLSGTVDVIEAVSGAFSKVIDSVSSMRSTDNVTPWTGQNVVRAANFNANNSGAWTGVKKRKN